MKDLFVNLHCHTLYSKQDSIIKINELVDKVKEFGQEACAVTDHSSTAAYFYFKNEAKRVGIKPIYGNEFYMNKNDNLKTRNRDHLLCLAMNEEGLKNINRLQDIAVKHHYYKPILPYDSLTEYSYGIYAILDINITGGNVNSTAYSGPICSERCNINITGGNIYLHALGSSALIAEDTINISGGYIEAKLDSKDNNDNESYLCTFSSNNGLNITSPMYIKSPEGCSAVKDEKSSYYTIVNSNGNYPLEIPKIISKSNFSQPSLMDGRDLMPEIYPNWIANKTKLIEITRKYIILQLNFTFRKIL